MEEGEAMEEVLYEIRYHAKMPFSSDSFKDEVCRGSTGGWRSYLSLQGAKQLKEKWTRNKRPKAFRKSTSFFVSPNGEYVAIASSNQITILQKGDNYTHPIGIFTSIDRLSVFTNGAWLETQGILGVIDDMSTLFLIKSSGEELARRTRSQLKLSAPILDLITQDDVNSEETSRRGFCIFTEDGLLHHVDICQEPIGCIKPIPASSNCLIDKKQSPRIVFCLDFNSDLSLGVLVGASSGSANSRDDSGFYSVYLFRLTSSLELELMFCSPQFKGLFLASKVYSGPFTSPKVSISPHGKYVAVLDLTGHVNLFNLNTENYSLSHISLAENQYSRISDSLAHESKETIDDVIDISWWTEHILILAKGKGNISMYNVVSGVKVIENDPIFGMPAIERMKHSQGHVFVLDSKSSAKNISVSENKKDRNMQHIKHIASLNEDQLDSGKLCWRLMSLSAKSVSEMYTVLISNQQYESALNFANRYRLDKNELYKEQWTNSDQGAHEINVLLPKITDQMFVLSECLDKVGPTEDTVKALLSYGLRITDEYKFFDLADSESSKIWDFRVIRLQLLQYIDKLETFVGINMGRFSAQEYKKFRTNPLSEAAINLAESGKIGAINLLLKRHPYSLSPQILDILSAIPETVPVQLYGQLLPGRLPPSTISLRERDWVECEKMITFINSLPNNSEKSIQVRTENILKQSVGFIWPSIAELSEWYKNRTRDIDILSGQLDNCLSLLEFACRKGLVELQLFLEEISYLHQLIYFDACEEDFAMNLASWEQLSDYEKFRIMLKGVKEETVVKRLRETAVPFMKKWSCLKPLDSEDKMEDQGFPHQDERDSFVVRWLKEIASDNLEICLAVIENGCGDSPVDGLFKGEAEIIETALHCIYICTLTDQWNTMASILSKLPRKTLRENSIKELNTRHGMQSLGTPRFSYLRSQLGRSEMQLSPSSPHDAEPAPQNSRGFVERSDNNTTDDRLERRIKLAEGHVEVGRLLASYQVAKPMSYFLGVQSDEKNVKQLLRLILSKFGRWQPGRSDNDWANMWRDMQCFQEKAFPFLDTEYMLIEFCRGLLKAGKFSLARNYLKGTGSIALATEKAENLVIQAAREYFFSASSLSCTEIWKAKECLSLFPNSKNVQAEADIIDVLTIRLPNLGVTLLPMQFKQIRNPMEIINMVISSQPGAYLNVEELIDIAKLLGLNSPDDIAAVEESITREAAVAGDLQLAFDLCLVLVKKGHGPIWDLCAAIARGPHLDNMNTSSRKQLLSFALSHCDEESIGELLHAWKDVDIHMQYENLMVSTRTSPPNFTVVGSSVIPLPLQTVQDIFDIRDSSKPVQHGTNFRESVSDEEVHFNNIKDILSKVGNELSFDDDGVSWDSLLRENRKALSFSALELPWLMELSGKEEYGKRAALNSENPPSGLYISIRTQALITILYWLAGSDIAPSDDLIASISKSIMEPPVRKEEDVLGCTFLLNLVDAFQGVEIIEEQLKQREGYQEMFSIMNIGMAYSSLQNSHRQCSSPNERRMLLIQKFQEKHASFNSDELEQIDKAQSTFWREWKTKLEEQKSLADQARNLEQIIPGIETTRFLSGDAEYIKAVVFSFVDSAKTEKKYILKEAVKLADTYGLNCNEVLLRFFGSALVSDHWGNDDILTEISEFREDIAKCAKDVVVMISSVVYPEIDGHNKQRLSYIYGILSACYLRLRKTDEQALLALVHQYQQHKKHNLEPFQFYKVLEQECHRVSFINDLDFKNIAGLDDLNFGHINEEISINIHESTVEALADMVRALGSICGDSEATACIMSWRAVYKCHIQGCLAYLESEISSVNPDELLEIVGKIELNYDDCKKYIRSLAETDRSYIIGRYCMLCIPPSSPSWKPSNESAQKDCLTEVLSFWIKMADEESLDTKHLARCLKILKKLVIEDEISTGSGWNTITGYSQLGLKGGLTADISSFFQAMVFSGCGFKFVAQVYSEAELYSTSLSLDGKLNDLVDIYIYMMEKSLLDLSRGCKEHKDLHHLLSSLSRLEGGDCAEDLNTIRCRVWRKLTAFSDDMQLESHLRVYALELMQAITGQNLASLPPDLASVVHPWEGWEQACFTTKSPTTAERVDGSSSSITSTLIALKSTRLVALISPNIKITPEDLVTRESAVSCFLHLSEMATSLPDLNVLQSVLEEWEVLFSSTGLEVNKESATTVESSAEEFNNWSSDEWDNEGWENLPEEELGKIERHKKDESYSIRVLHSCWMEIIRKLIGFSMFDLVMEMLDRSFSKSDGVEVLLNEDEAKCLYELVVQIDCFFALKMLLLLPYNGPRSQCLHAVEATLKNLGGNPSNESLSVDNGYELLILVLSSGVLKDVAINPTFGKVFSYLCHLVGYFARLCQEDLLECRRDNHKGTLDQKTVSLFCTVLFPCFISQLVEAGQCLLAGFIVSQWMHTHSSLGLIDVVEASLRRYLEGQFLATGQLPGGESAGRELEPYGSLVYSLSRLRGKVGSMLQSAISALPSDTRR